MEPLHTLPPDQMLLQIVLSRQLSCVLAAAEDLSLADHLAAGSKTATELAALTGTLEDPLYRVLRVLAAVGIFEERDDRAFANTDASRLIGGDRSTFPRALVRWINCRPIAAAWDSLPYSLTTGKPGVRSRSRTQLLRAQRRRSRICRQSQRVHGVSDRPLRDGDRRSHRLLTIHVRSVDIGGCTGTLASTIVAAHPHLRGMVLDLPHVIRGVAGTHANIEYLPGNFLEAVPPGLDGYLVKHVLHDWDDAVARGLLERCRQAMSDTGRLLIVEHIVSSAPRGSCPSARYRHAGHDRWTRTDRRRVHGIDSGRRAAHHPGGAADGHAVPY